MTLPRPSPARRAEPSARFWRGMLALSILLALGGLYAFYAASVRPRPAPAAGAREVTVTIRDGACHPADITVPAGRTRFVIVNQSRRALEWEILDGVMVVDERENITPGMRQTLSVRLRPGEFEITCGLLSSPRGRLRVLPSAESQQRAQAPRMVDFIGVLAEYRVYTVLQLGDARDALEQARAAWDAGDAVQARARLLEGYQAYASLAPVAQSFADLDARLDVRAAYLAQRGQDPAFTGWRSLAAALAPQAPRAAAERVPELARRALADLDLLGERLRAPALTPQQMLKATALAWRRQASHADGGDAAADDGMDGAARRGLAAGTRKVAELLQPVLTPVPAAQWAAIGEALRAWPDGEPGAGAAPPPAAAPARRPASLQASMLAAADALDRAAEDGALDEATQPAGAAPGNPGSER